MREVRALREDEIPQLCRVVGEAFKEDSTSWVMEQQQYEPGYRHCQTRVAVVDGRVVSSLIVLRRPIHYAGATIPMLGVGNVSTLPSEEGRGHASAILRQVAELAPGWGYPLGMLFTDIPGFYRRLGWEAVPVLRACFRPLPSGVPARSPIRRFQPETMTGEVARAVAPIYEAANRDQVGPIARWPEYWEANVIRRWRRCHLWLAEGAYVVLSPERETLDIHEGGYLPGAEAAARDLLAEATHMARALGKPLMRAPGHPALRPELWEGSAEVASESTDTGMMCVIFDWPALVRYILPALQERWRQAGRPVLETTLCHRTGEVAVVGTPRGLEIAGGVGGTRYNLDDAQAIPLLFGQWQAIPDLDRPELRALFAGPTPAFWPGDGF